MATEGGGDDPGEWHPRDEYPALRGRPLLPVVPRPVGLGWRRPRWPLRRLRPAGRETAEDAMREICSANGGLENLSDEDASTVLRALSLVAAVLDEAEHAEEAR